MNEQEETIREGVNAMGQEATAHALRQHDADGRPIEVEGQRHTATSKPVKKDTSRPTESSS